MRVHFRFRKCLCIGGLKSAFLQKGPMYDANEKYHTFNVLKHGSSAKVCLLLNICNCSPTTELLETITHLLTYCSRFYLHADRNMAENLTVYLEVAVNSVRHLFDSSDRDDQANAERIPPLESLVRQLQIL